MCADTNLTEEFEWYRFFQKKHTPALFVVNKADVLSDAEKIRERIEEETQTKPVPVSAKEGLGIEELREELVRLLPENYGTQFITGELVEEDDLVLLVMPQDIQAPKGRLILPQVQTMRELLDKKCLVMSVTTDRLEAALAQLRQPPKLIITDSQVFPYVYARKPKESMLTSFSVLFAAYKGDLPYYVEGAKQLDRLNESSRVLDRGMLYPRAAFRGYRKGEDTAGALETCREGIAIDMVSGTDYPQDLSGYDLIIQCGACMFNRKYVMSRIERAKEQRVPMTNYGVTIAHLTGILPNVAFP